MIFAERLKFLRTRKNVTQQELASLLGTSRTAIAGYETLGKQPNFDMLIKLAEYFGVTTDFLLGASDKEFEKDVSSHFIGKINELFATNKESSYDEHDTKNFGEWFFDIFYNSYRYGIEYALTELLLHTVNNISSVFYWIDKANEEFTNSNDKQAKINFLKANTMSIPSGVEDDFIVFIEHCYDLMENGTLKKKANKEE